MAVVTKIVHLGPEAKLFRAIAAQKPEFSFSVFQRLLRKKDIKVNGKRVSENIDVFDGDEICYYQSEQKIDSKLDLVYCDDNVVIVDKPDGVEVESESGDKDLVHILKEQGIGTVFAVHRLDRNTTGLVVFARNLKAKKELDDAFKNRTIHKFYLARVYGYMEKKSADAVAYLKKDERQMKSIVTNVPSAGFVKIETKYKEISRRAESAECPIRTSLLEVELVTGKMHQIRAHLAFLGHAIVGDGKYADNSANKRMKQKKQLLCAYKLIFSFEKDKLLSYLNGRQFVIDVKF